MGQLLALAEASLYSFLSGSIRMKTLQGGARVLLRRGWPSLPLPVNMAHPSFPLTLVTQPGGNSGVEESSKLNHREMKHHAVDHWR
jgi:hypothetical protein